MHLPLLVFSENRTATAGDLSTRNVDKYNADKLSLLFLDDLPHWLLQATVCKVYTRLFGHLLEHKCSHTGDFFDMESS